MWCLLDECRPLAPPPTTLTPAQLVLSIVLFFSRNPQHDIYIILLIMEVIRNIKLKHFKGFVAGTGQLTQGAIDASCVNITHHAKLSTDSAHMYIS